MASSARPEVKPHASRPHLFPCGPQRPLTPPLSPALRERSLETCLCGWVSLPLPPPRPTLKQKETLQGSTVPQNFLDWWKCPLVLFDAVAPAMGPWGAPGMWWGRCKNRSFHVIKFKWI